MSRERLQLVREGFEAWNSGDREWVLEHMSPEVEWVTPPNDPYPGTYRGYLGVEEYWSQWRAAVGQLRFELEELIDAGDNVVAVAKRTARSHETGLGVSDMIVQVFTFDDEDVCVRVREFYDRAAALEAAGASEAGQAG